MGEQAQRDWQKGLEECTNPEHNHIADASKMVKHWEWFDRLVYYATGIYIGGVMATGKWIWW